MAEGLTDAQQLAVIAAAVARIETHQKDAVEASETLASEVRDLHTMTADLARRMAAVEPVTQMVTGWQARMTGAMMVLGLLGTVAGFGWLLIKDRIAAVWAAIIGG